MGDIPMNMLMDRMNRPHWQSVALSALHCGAGCTLVGFACAYPMNALLIKLEI